jgi:transposase-like protein
MSDRSDYHPRSKRTHYLHVRISEEDRARLVRLSHARGQSGAEVIRDLLAAAAGATEGT